MYTRRVLALVLAIPWLWPAGLYAQSEAFLQAYEGRPDYSRGKASESARATGYDAPKCRVSGRPR